MKKSRNLGRRVILAAAALVLAGSLWVATPAAHADTTIIVNTTEDLLAVNDNCSLREAVYVANSDEAYDDCEGGSGTDTIGFNIGASGSQQTITLASYLQIYTPVILDGRTQPGYAGTPLIHITGAIGTLLNFYGSADGSAIHGLQFSQTGGGSGSAVQYDGQGFEVTGSYFQTDGTASLSSTNSGIYISGGGTTIGGATAAERDIFGGVYGVWIDGASGGNTIQGNYFGVQTDGSTALTGAYGTGGTAITIDPGTASSNGSTLRGNVIGGFNIGIRLGKFAQSNTIAGNYIGVGADGHNVISNGTGISLLGSDNNTIGGTAAGDRNVISGNEDINVFLAAGVGPDVPTANTIQGNYIGLSADGLTGLSPLAAGVEIDSGADTVIGTVTALGVNVISGNENGIIISTGVTGTTIRNNAIGTDPGGEVAIPNGTYGILSSSAVNIGDAVTPGYNCIAGDGTGIGIYLLHSSGSTVYGNSVGVGDSGAALGLAAGLHLQDSSAVLGGNLIAFNSGDGVFLDATSTIAAGSTLNCFAGNTTYGVESSNTGSSAPLTQNWWGSATGPYHPVTNADGEGDAVSDYVAYEPYLTEAPSICVPRLRATVGASVKGDYEIQPGAAQAEIYTGTNNGPVVVKNHLATDILASEQTGWMAGGVIKSAAETMGMPEAQLSDVYYFPWIAQSTWVDTELRIANVGDASSSVNVTIGSNSYGPYTVNAHTTSRQHFTEVAGPVKVDGTDGVPLVVSERMAWKVAGNVTTVADMIGIPSGLTGDNIVFPWYQQDSTTDTELRIANVGGSSSSVTVTIGATVYGPYTINANQTTRRKFTGEATGPMIVDGTDGIPLAVTQRLAWKVGGNVRTVTEMPGLPAVKATDTAYFPWYTHNTQADTVLRIATIGPSGSVVAITIGGVSKGNHTVSAGETVELEFPGVNAGSVKLQGTADVPLVVSQLIKWKWTSLVWSRAEVMGLPDGQLDSAYYFPWYAQVNGKWTQTELRLAVP